MCVVDKIQDIYDYTAYTINYDKLNRYIEKMQEVIDLSYLEIIFF